jgi:hypothetical protein
MDDLELERMAGVRAPFVRLWAGEGEDERSIVSKLDSPLRDIVGGGEEDNGG